MAAEMNPLDRVGTSSGLSEQDIHVIVNCCRRPEFTKDLLEDIRTAGGCEPKAAHSQWSKS